MSKEGNMHPYRTAFIGLFLIGIAIAQDTFEAAYLNSRLYNQGDIPDIYGETPYWWMNRGSPFKRSFQPSSSGCGPECQSTSGTLQVTANDYSNNPFLSGNSISSDASYSSNPFVNSGKPFASQVDASSGSGPYTYMAPGYLPPQENIETIPCSGQGKACVTKYLCNNGFVEASKVQGSSQNCNSQNEVCCTILVPTQPPTQPPRPTTPYQPQPQSTPCVDQNYGCVSPDQCINGVVARTPNRPSSQKCFAPEVCCRYEDNFPSQNQVTNDVRPTPRPTPSVTPGEVLTSEGYVITVPKTKFPPPPPTTQRPYVPPQTQRPYVPPTTQREYVPPQTQRPYVPPQTTQRPYVPPQTQRPYVPPQTQRPYAPPQTQRPYVPPRTTPAPFKGEEYIPPKDNHIGEPSNDNPYTNYLPPNKPERGEDEKSEPIENPSNVNQNIIRPNRPTERPQDAAPVEPPTQCPAATNCTEIQYCTAEGSISKSIVSLTKDQEIYRVPLSDCRNVEKGFIGKCCRDPDYVDPWPVGILGQYNASILGFDDGSYKPGASGNGKQERRNGNRAPSRPNDINIPSGSNQGLVAIRGQAQLSLPIPQTSQTQNSYTRTPFPQTNQPNQIFGRDKSPQNSIEPIASGSNVCAVRDVNAVPKGNGPFDAAFGEFPWQAMILKESTKTLLCGGAIVEADTVLTAAHCVEGVQAFDLLIKGGEWKLGSDEEPKSFQSIRVKSISVHPEYQSNKYGRDIALLHLERPLKFDKHIGAICLDDREPTPNDNCVCTGWGKEALKYHAAGALMHSIPINPLAQSECQASVDGHNPSTACCGRPQADACQLDPGSALACDSGNGKYTLKGIYSAETECASPSTVVTFAKMDVPWIKNTMSSPSAQPQQQRQTVAQPNYRPTYQSQQPSTSQLAYSTQAPSYLPPRQ
ncbi:inactive serine protease scarface-like isoform X1 [Bradysia coprophila]|uniref:inactive serine protease scarface-like isoform X1 n=2 Tax=Bradysia coprophila TaxID=38358 RepID=UPI00187DB0F6|nr:inactive serine protease scarface-like isoform X1 [Bradysia coprophila]